jgi:F0F1-type ATP synthase assembly protein I
MKTIIWMEMLLLGASILIFRSVWTFLDSIAWASGGVGLAVLLVVGMVAAVVALRSIEALAGQKGGNAQGE